MRICVWVYEIVNDIVYMSVSLCNSSKIMCVGVRIKVLLWVYETNQNQRTQNIQPNVFIKSIEKCMYV